MALSDPESGFLVVRQPTVIVERFRSVAEGKGYLEALACLRAAFSFIDAAAYRGMCRDALEPYPTQGLDVFFKDQGRDMASDKAARQRFLELLGDDGPLIPDFATASELHSLLDRPDAWEIIRVAKNASHTETTLGYDLGWWGSPEYYSLIWDCAIAPTWHGPPDEDLEAVAEQLQGLNRWALFDSPQDALAFRAYYVERPWAESEDPQFEPVRIEAAGFVAAA